MTFRPNPESQRLLGAADLLLKAMTSQAGMNSLITIHFDVPRADAAAPSWRYTLMELVDAMTMLIHMGIVPFQQSSGSARRDGRHDGHSLNHARQKRQTESNDESRHLRSSADRPRVRIHGIRMKCAANGATMN